MNKLLPQRKEPKPEEEQDKNLDEKTKRCLKRIKTHQAKQAINLALIENDGDLARIDHLIDDLVIESNYSALSLLGPVGARGE